MKNKNAKIKQTQTISTRITRYLLLGLATVLSLTCAIVPLAAADTYDQQIKALQSENGDKQQQTQVLRVEANGLQATISGLGSQITAIQNLIADNQNKSVQLQKQIEIAQAELEKQKNLLGENIKAMYIEGQVSTIEMLASSKDLSEYFDKQQYRDIIKNKIKSSLDNVTALKAQLRDQQDRLKKLIDEQTLLQNQLTTQKAEQDRLLNMNQGQQADLDKQIKTNYGKISELKRQQAIENAKLFSNGLIPAGRQGGGGYPGVWAFAPIDSMLDSWGMYNRECVSYTAYKVAVTGRNMPKWGLIGMGNANQWDDNARDVGIPVDGNPKAGDVIISNAGTYGHALYAEVVSEDGAVYVSDYNQQYDGLYREYWIPAATVKARSLLFIHFP